MPTKVNVELIVVWACVGFLPARVGPLPHGSWGASLA